MSCIIGWTHFYSHLRQILLHFCLCMRECLHIHNFCAVCVCADHNFGCCSSGTVQPSFFLLIVFLTDCKFAKDGRLADQCTQVHPSLPIVFSVNLISGIKKKFSNFFVDASSFRIVHLSFHEFLFPVAFLAVQVWFYFILIRLNTRNYSNLLCLLLYVL